MGRKLAAALVLLAASRLPFIQHEGKRAALETGVPHLQSSVAAILTRLKLELWRQRASQEQQLDLAKASAGWNAFNVHADSIQGSEKPKQSLAEGDKFVSKGSKCNAAPLENSTNATTTGDDQSATSAERPPQSGKEKEGPNWLQRLGFSGGESGGSDDELADVILKHLGFLKDVPESASEASAGDARGSANRQSKSASATQKGHEAAKDVQDKIEESRIGAKEQLEGRSIAQKEHEFATSSGLFAVDSDGAGRREVLLQEEDGEDEKGGGLDLVKEGYASLKEKVGLQIFQDIADPVIGLYKKAVAKGSELETVANLRMLADIASSIRSTTAEMAPWSLSDLTLGLYLLSLEHASEGVQDAIPGQVVTDRETVEDWMYHLELARGAYARDPAGLARVSMLRECRVVKFRERATLQRPAYYIAADDRKRLVILGIRGTTQAHDLFTDLATAGEEFLDGGYAHAGILRAATWFVEHEAATLKKQLQENPGYALRLVGHSLGGGTAAVIAILLQDKPELVGVRRGAISAVCFSPPACLSRSLADRTSAFVQTLVMQDDVIPRASARAMDRLRQEVERTDWSASGPGESLANLKGVASRHLESLQPTLQKLQAVAMDYAPAVLASKVTAASAAGGSDAGRSEEGGKAPGEYRASAAEESLSLSEDVSGDSDVETGAPVDAYREQTGDRGESVDGGSQKSGGGKCGNKGLERDPPGMERLSEASESSSSRPGIRTPGTRKRPVDVADEEGEIDDFVPGGKDSVTGPHEELFAPGRLYHLVYRDKQSRAQPEESKPQPKMYRLIQGSETARLNRIVLSKSMLQDHASKDVYWGLRELLKVMP